jgi:hypothetical protein
MKSRRSILVALIALSTITAVVLYRQKQQPSDMNIIFLHHSTGGVIWKGAQSSLAVRAANKLSPKLAELLGRKARLPLLFEQYNKANHKQCRIKEIAFPKASPYGWHNYPFDYYNLWVKHAGEKPFMEEPTLEMLTKQYQVIIFKHCFPVSNIKADTNSPDINSDYKSLANYKLQYLALRDKLHQFPDTKFVALTGAAQVKSCISEEEAKRAREFFQWVTGEWDLPQDNIFLWDLYELQTEGGLYFKDNHARAADDSHPNGEFAGKAAQLFFNRIVDVLESNGTTTRLTGEKK